MFDLKSSGLNLRTITPKEYGELISDLNYNFTQLLNLPGFKGRQGDSIQGPQGIGIRGSKWVFVQLSAMTTTYGVTASEDVDLNFINTVFNDNPQVFFDSIYIPLDTELIIGDILVLPNGQLIELGQVDDGLGGLLTQFIDTGLTFDQIATITESKVIQIFNQLFQDNSSAVGAFRHYLAVAKNNTDASPALNQNSNNDSVIDVVVADSGPGAQLPNHTFVGTTETTVPQSKQMCLLVGSVARYHELIQSTQTLHTNNYAPGIDDYAALVVFQNSYKNGILFGHRDSDAIRQFGRLYRSINATILTSSYSPNTSEFSDLTLADDEITIRAQKATVTATQMSISAITYQNKFFSYAGTIAKLSNVASSTLEIYAPTGTLLKNVVNANFLSTDATGKIVKPYTLIIAMPASPTNAQLMSALAIKNLLTPINNTLTTYGTRITNLENASNATFFKQVTYITSTTNMNSVVEYGNYYINAGVSISNFAPGITSAPANMHVRVFTMTSGTTIRLKQEVTYSGSTVGNYNEGSSWFRVAARTGAGAGIWTWNPWTRVITNSSKPQGQAPILVEGTFADNSLIIKHATSGASSTTNSGVQVIRNINLDGFGHITGIQSVDLSSLFISTSTPISPLPWASSGGTSVINSIRAFFERNKPRVITTSTFDVGSNTGAGVWYTIPYSTAVQGSFNNRHNIAGHTVKYRLTRFDSSTKVEIEIARTTASADDWRFTSSFVESIFVGNLNGTGLPMFAPVEEMGTFAGTISGSTVKKFYLREAAGAGQSMWFRIVIQNVNEFVD